MLAGPVAGNIPEVLDNGEVTEGTRVTAAGPRSDLATNTAASGNNAAAIQSLDGRDLSAPGHQGRHNAAGLVRHERRALRQREATVLPRPAAAEVYGQ